MPGPRHHSKGFGRTSSGAWEIGMARMPAFVPGDDGEPIRPLLALVMDASGRIRAMASGHPDQPTDALEEALRQAIEQPSGDCQPGLPERVVVPKANLLAQLQPLLPGVAISVGPTPLLDDAMASLREHFREEIPAQQTLAIPTYLTADVTPTAVASFFEAAAALYERQPWLRFPSDSHLFQVSSTALGIRGWVGSVIGQNRESYGLILFDSIAAYERYVQLAEYSEREGARPSDGFPRHRALNYEAKAVMPDRLLMEISRHHWRVAKGDGYPTVMLIEPDLVLAPPTRADLRRLEAVARALVRLIDTVPELALARRWQGPELLRRRFRLPVQGQEVSITIGVAEDGVEMPEPAQKPAKKERVPAAMQAKVDSLMQGIDGFCDTHLNGEYRQLIHAAVCALARKRPSPLLGGREPSWCAGLVHAIGTANFLFDKSQTPHCKAPVIYTHFGISAQTGQAHSKKVRELLRIGIFDPKWTLPSKLDNTPMAWMVEVDGFIRDIRTLPIEVQVEACALGLIPYVPALRDASG